MLQSPIFSSKQSIDDVIDVLERQTTSLRVLGTQNLESQPAWATELLAISKSLVYEIHEMRLVYSASSSSIKDEKVGKDSHGCDTTETNKSGNLSHEPKQKVVALEDRLQILRFAIKEMYINTLGIIVPIPSKTQATLCLCDESEKVIESKSERDSISELITKDTVEYSDDNIAGSTETENICAVEACGDGIGATVPAAVTTVESSSKSEHTGSDKIVQRGLEEALVTTLKQGCGALVMYITKLCEQPNVPRYRKITTTNQSFRSLVQPLNGHEKVLESVGFVRRTNFYEWVWFQQQNGRAILSNIKDTISSRNPSNATETSSTNDPAVKDVDSVISSPQTKENSAEIRGTENNYGTMMTSGISSESVENYEKLDSLSLHLDVPTPSESTLILERCKTILEKIRDGTYSLEDCAENS